MFCITAVSVLYISLSSEKTEKGNGFQSIETHRRWSYSEIVLLHCTSSENLYAKFIIISSILHVTEQDVYLVLREALCVISRVSSGFF
jgi:hypothetical protein